MSDDTHRAQGPMVQRSKNLTEQVHAVIKQRITSGYYAQGDRLVERTLAEEFDVSKTPVREALAQLEREKLVIRIPDRGIEVRTLSLEEMEYILDLRALLEGFFTRKAATRMTESDLKELRDVLAEAAQAVEECNYEKYKEKDIQFHRIIRNRSGNAIAGEIMSSLEDQIHLLMTTSVHLPGRAKESILCHHEILAAIECGDADASERAARKHIENIKKAVVSYLVERTALKRPELKDK